VSILFLLPGEQSFKVTAHVFRSGCSGLILPDRLRFGNGFPQTQPQFLEKSYTFEVQFVISEIARSYDNAAVYLMFQGKYDEAGSFFHKAYELAPKEPQILGDLGLFYGKQNQPAKALDYFTKARASQPDNLTWLYNIALAEGQLGKIDEEKRDLQNIIDNPQVDQAYKQTVMEQMNSLNQQVSSSEASIKPKMQPVPSGWKQFTNAAMNVVFAYPQTLRLTRLSPQLVSLSDPAHSSMDDELLIYSTELSSENLHKILVVFHITGQLKQSQPIQFPGFQAVMNVYTDTAGQKQLLLLKQGQQIFAIRFPKEAAFNKEVLIKIVQSIATLH
jgi:tetratricopeptide (TPR) repeat protein